MMISTVTLYPLDFYKPFIYKNAADVHYLYILSVLFIKYLAVLLIFNKLYPSNEFDLKTDFSKVVGSYIIFSPLGIAA